MDIIEATKKGDIDAVRRCIARNEDVNTKDNNGYTALIWASWNGYSDIAELLIRSEADVNVKDNNGDTALIWASLYGYTDVVELLLQSGANPNKKNNHGNTALIWASRWGYADVAELLLQSGANVNAKDNNGETALMQASQYGYRNVAKLLLISGADVNAKDNYGRSALMYALWNGYVDTAERIVSVAMDDPCVSYTTVALSSFVPRWEDMNAQDYVGFVAKFIPLYLNLAVANAMFGRDMQRDVEEILDGKTEINRRPLTKKDASLLTKLRKTLRSIDYTDRVKSKDDENTVSVYDMEL